MTTAEQDRRRTWPRPAAWQRQDEIAGYDLARKMAHYQQRITRALRRRAEKMAHGHIIDIDGGILDRGVSEIYNPPPGERQPAGTIHARKMHKMHREIAQRLGKSKRRIAIMSALATGWVPWGVDMRQRGRVYADLPLCRREYVLCCGHVFGRKEAQLFVDTGLLMPGPPDLFDRPALIITDAGRVWLQMNW
jgi:hypothetical protein